VESLYVKIVETIIIPLHHDKINILVQQSICSLIYIKCLYWFYWGDKVINVCNDRIQQLFTNYIQFQPHNQTDLISSSWALFSPQNHFVLRYDCEGHDPGAVIQWQTGNIRNSVHHTTLPSISLYKAPTLKRHSHCAAKVIGVSTSKYL
jgi:hypothetical protein